VRSGSSEDGTYSLEEEFRMKKILVALIAALVLAPQTQAAGKKLRIAVSLPPANNAWQAKMLDSVNEEVAKDTTNFEITVKNAVDDADQLNMMQTFKAGGYDLIAILPGNGTLMTPIVQDIFKSGTKVMVIDRPIEGDQYTVFYGGDNAQCGKNAAKYIGDRLKGKGQVAVLRSYVGIPIDQQRYGGFMEVLKASYPGIKVLVEGDGEFNQQAGLKAISNILPAYPQIDAIFSQDDESAVGALTAIKSANRKDIQFVTGMGGSKSAFARMAAKDPLYGASMSYLPTMGGHALALAKKILKGEKFNKMNIEPTIVVTSENVSKYMADAY
jgi:ribose transport system substrate-binding protein